VSDRDGKLIENVSDADEARLWSIACAVQRHGDCGVRLERGELVVVCPCGCHAPEPAAAADDEGRPCSRCLGCGQVAGGSDDREPWSAWADLPPGSDLAVRVGLVWPEPCDQCGGSGRRRG
jgi:hypothetical protein